jgi:hypothetical protein
MRSASVSLRFSTSSGIVENAGSAELKRACQYLGLTEWLRLAARRLSIDGQDDASEAQCSPHRND